MLLSRYERPKDRARFNKDFSLLQLYCGCLFYVGGSLLLHRDGRSRNKESDIFVHQRCNERVPYWLSILAPAPPQIEELVSANRTGSNHSNTSDKQHGLFGRDRIGLPDPAHY